MAKGRKTGGRVAGTPNKFPSDIKQMILAALHNVGGAEYLERQAEANPGPFMTLVGKILPTQLEGTGPDGAIVITGVRRLTDGKKAGKDD